MRTQPGAVDAHLEHVSCIASFAPMRFVGIDFQLLCLPQVGDSCKSGGAAILDCEPGVNSVEVLAGTAEPTG